MPIQSIKIYAMKVIKDALEFERRKMTNMTTSDRVAASREAKDLILSINEIYKETKESDLMDLMKRLTEKKRRIEKRLKGMPSLI